MSAGIKAQIFYSRNQAKKLANQLRKLKRDETISLWALQPTRVNLSVEDESIAHDFGDALLEVTSTSPRDSFVIVTALPGFASSFELEEQSDKVLRAQLPQPAFIVLPGEGPAGIASMDIKLTLAP